MSTEKFTQGEWLLGVPTDNAPFCIDSVCNKDGLQFEVCAVWGVDDDSLWCEQSQANAHLISAAPDMYRALRDVADELPAEPDYFDYHTVRLTKEEVQAIRAALAKADGEQL